MRERELQAANMLLKLPDEETAETLKAGTLDREPQLLSMLLIFVTAAVLSNGMAAKELQRKNMVLIFVTAAVLNNGMVTKDLPT